MCLHWDFCYLFQEGVSVFCHFWRWQSGLLTEVMESSFLDAQSPPGCILRILQDCWTRWSPEVFCNSYHSVVLMGAERSGMCLSIKAGVDFMMLLLQDLKALHLRAGLGRLFCHHGSSDSSWAFCYLYCCCVLTCMSTHVGCSCSVGEDQRPAFGAGERDANTSPEQGQQYLYEDCEPARSRASLDS